MRMSKVTAVRWLPLLALAAVLSGCGKDRDDAPAEVAAKSTAPLPALPEWAKPLMGKTLQDFPSSKACKGAFDAVKVRHAGTPSGVEVEGWAWLTDQKAAPIQILFVDIGGDIVGAGQTTMDRPDVPKAVSDVTTAKVGWHGVVQAASGKITALAALPDRALCPVGTKDIGG
jgi:hypothetical protein